MQGYVPRQTLNRFFQDHYPNYLLKGAANLKEKDLSNEDLRNIDFSGAICEKVSFFGADLRGAKFNGTQLEEACLTEVQGLNSRVLSHAIFEHLWANDSRSQKTITRALIILRLRTLHCVLFKRRNREGNTLTMSR